MKDSENFTNSKELQENPKSTKLELVETHTEGLRVLSEMSKVAEDTPENLLLLHAQRLNNVAHSFIEQREQSYLNNTLEEMERGISEHSIQAVCKLTQEARENLKLVVEFQKIKAQNFKTIVEAIKSK